MTGLSRLWNHGDLTSKFLVVSTVGMGSLGSSVYLMLRKHQKRLGKKTAW